MNILNSKHIYTPTMVFTVVIFLLFLVVRLLGFDGLYGQDSYEYLRYSNALYNSFNGGEPAGDYFWPLFYPLIGAIVNFLFQDMQVTLSFINLTAFTLSSIYIYKIITLLYANTKYSIYYIIIFFIFSPAIFTSGLVLMSDILSACFIILSIYHALKFDKTTSVNSIYYLVIFAVCAIMTRYACFVVLFPFGILVLSKLLKNRRLLLHLIPILLIIGVLSVPHFYIRSDNVSGFLSHDWLKQWSIFNFFKSEFITVDGSSYNRFPNIIYAFFNAFHPRFLVIGIVLVAASFLKSINFKPNKTLLIAYVLYSLFLAGIPFQNPRFLILNFGLILIILYPIFETLLARFLLYKKITNFGFSALFVVQLFLSLLVLQPFYFRSQLEKSIANVISPYQTKTLYSFDIDVALKGRDLDFNFKNLWITQYNSFNPKDLVLFNPEKFKTQWKGKNPMLNWENIEKNYNLKVLEDAAGGWKLYEIQSKKQPLKENLR